MSTELDRISELAKEDAKRQFYSIAHMITPEALYAAFRGLRKKASAGVDGVTHEEYEKNATRNIRLCTRIRKNMQLARVSECRASAFRGWVCHHGPLVWRLHQRRCSRTETFQAFFSWGGHPPKRWEEERKALIHLGMPWGMPTMRSRNRKLCGYSQCLGQTDSRFWEDLLYWANPF